MSGDEENTRLAKCQTTAKKTQEKKNDEEDYKVLIRMSPEDFELLKAIISRYKGQLEEWRERKKKSSKTPEKTYKTKKKIPEFMVISDPSHLVEIGA